MNMTRATSAEVLVKVIMVAMVEDIDEIDHIVNRSRFPSLKKRGGMTSCPRAWLFYLDATDLPSGLAIRG
jgi:hypothetical protein